MTRFNARKVNAGGGVSAILITSPVPEYLGPTSSASRSGCGSASASQSPSLRPRRSQTPASGRPQRGACDIAPGRRDEFGPQRAFPLRGHGYRRPHDGVRLIWRPTAPQSRPRIWSTTGIGFHTVVVSTDGRPDDDFRLRTLASGTRWFHRQMISSR